LVRVTGHLSWLAAILVSDWWCFVGDNFWASYWMVLAAISGPLGWCWWRNFLVCYWSVSACGHLRWLGGPSSIG
jgi:hypothetical protein